MVKDTEVTRVVFRKFKEGDVIALFPEMDEGRGMIGSYLLVGQHGSASPSIVNDTKLATPEEYKEIKDELEKAFGYNLDVRKKLN